MENNTTQILKNNLILLRRNAHLTQEQFADKLGLSFQAVSKWENGLSCPDIALLPEIAKIYGISVDKLFTPIEAEELSQPEAPTEEPAQEETPKEREQAFESVPSGDFGASLGQYVSRIVEQAMEKASAKLQKKSFDGFNPFDKNFHFDFDPASHPKFETAESVQVDGLPWADDGVYRAVLFKGTKLVTPPAENGGTLAVDELEGSLLSAFSVTCDTVEGDVRCVLGSLTCDEIEGDVTYCTTVNADEIAGDVRQCSTINCDEINGNAVQCTNVYCDEINVD